jgi:hypothetical protein
VSKWLCRLSLEVAGAGVALYLLDIRNMLIESKKVMWRLARWRNGHMIILVFNTWLCGRVVGLGDESPRDRCSRISMVFLY